MWIQHLVQSIKGTGIIYCGKRRECEQINEFLQSIGMKSEYFHAGRAEHDKKNIQERFMNDRHPKAVDVIASTNAFGLGVDKANIRFIIHSAIPGTVEEYFQEAGRSGRDGKRSFCILLYTYDDRSLQEWFIENSLVSREELIEIYEAIDSSSEVENFRVVKYDDIFWFVDLDETKIRVGISHLERLGMVRRLPDVDSKIAISRMLNDDAAALEKLSHGIHQGKLRIIKAILEAIRQHETLDLPEFCNRHKFNPMSVFETLYDLEFEGIINLRRSKRAMLFKIEKPVQALRKLRLKELGLEEYREHRYHKLEQMLNYAEIKKCRVRYIREYFGEKVAEDCGRCDNCRIKKGWQPANLVRKASPPTTISDTSADYFDEEMLSHAILSTVRDVDGRVGKNVVADILKGSRAKIIKSMQFDKLKTYGKLPYFRKEPLVETIKMLILKRLIEEKRPIGFDYPVVTLSQEGMQFLQEREAIGKELLLPPDPDNLSKADQAIYNDFRKLRTRAGNRTGLLPFQILPKKTLKEIALLKPRTLAQLSYIRELSDSKLEKYGGEILKIVASHVQHHTASDGKFSDQEFITVKKFIGGQMSHALHGDFDVGFALANHTEIHEGKRDYTAIGRMVYEFKYQGNRSHLDTLTNEIVRFIDENENYKKADIIVPVPSTASDRDYDPVSLIVQRISECTGIPVTSDVLVKARKARPQKQLVNITQKKLNVKGAFKINNREKINRKTIILVDDLYDSGATLNECVRVLRSSGAGKILVLVLTRTVHSS
jgi:superfamily II DNA helicase RecQ